MDFRRRRRTRHGKRKHRKQKKTRKHLTIKPPNKEIDFSPISSPGSFNNALSPNTTPPNTPITRRAKELASLYPNRASMIARSKSFNNEAMNTETFYREFEQLFPNRNGPSYP
jgi:hypothetical protein